MFLTIKKIPKTSWSSPKPLNFKPKVITFIYLCLGLALFGLGEGLLLVSLTGASPWSVLAQGISLNLKLSIGTTTFLVSMIVLFFLDTIKSKARNWNYFKCHNNFNNDRYLYKVCTNPG